MIRCAKTRSEKMEGAAPRLKCPVCGEQKLLYNVKNTTGCWTCLIWLGKC